MQWSLLLWMLAWAAAGAAVWDRCFRSLALGVRWALALICLALLPLLPALAAGRVYGPFDTNLGKPPWTGLAPPGYRTRGGALNDITLQIAPWQAEARRQLLAGRVPLLNPWSGAGQPLLADGQSAPFSPVSLLVLPFDAVHAQVARAFFKLLLALAGAFLAARQLGCRPAACLLAAVAYAYGGSLSIWRLFPIGEVVAWWPLAFLAGERLLADPGEMRSRALLLLAVAGLLLAGHPETALMAGLALCARWVVALVAVVPGGGGEGRGRAPQARGVAACALCCLLAVACTGCFTLPLAQTLLGSERVGETRRGAVAASPSSRETRGALANMAAPGVFGTPQGAGEHGPAPLDWLAEGSVGLLCLVLATAGLVAGEAGADRGADLFLALLAGCALAVHLDLAGLAGRLFAVFPLSLVSRRACAYLAGFAVALLAAGALERWWAGAETAHPDGARRWGQAAAAWSCCLVGLLVALAAPWEAMRFWQGGATPELLAEATRHGGWAVAAAVGAALCLALRRRPWVSGLLASGLTAGQLLSAYGGTTPVVAERYAYPEVPVLARLSQEPGPFRLVGTRGVFVPNSSTIYRLADIRTHDPAEPHRYVDWLVDLLDLDRATYKKQYRRPVAAHEPYLRLLGVRFLVAARDVRPPPPWREVESSGETRLWELPGPVRWAFFPASVVPVASEEAARATLRQAIASGGGDPYRLATLELEGVVGPPPPASTGNPGPALGGVSGAQRANGEGRILWWEVESGRLRLGVETRTGGWLVVSQTALPGWRAEAGGLSLPTAIADGVLLAVKVPPGTHLIHLRYLPASWLAGLALSAAGLAAGALLVVARASGRARRPRAGWPTPVLLPIPR